MRTLITEIVRGHRTIVGTDHPVVDQVHRHGPREWVVTSGLCNGVPDGATTYRTRREALAAFRNTRYHVYRWDGDDTCPETVLLGTAETLSEALSMASRLGGHQVQEGLTGEVWGV